MTDAERLAANLRLVRTKSGLSQQTVAEALDLPRTAITNMENGHRAVSTLEVTKLAKLYGKPITVFFKGLDFNNV